MITDRETNTLYISPLLKQKYPAFYEEFIYKLKEHKVLYHFLKGTKDVWCRDYMPVQIDLEKYVYSLYDPDYLKTSKYKYTKTKNIRLVFSLMDLGVKKLSGYLIEGGNIVKSKNKIIATERIYKDNPRIPQDFFPQEFKRLFEVDDVIIIPELPNDFTGHADGMVRFLNDDQVLVSDLSEEPDKNFVRKFYETLEKHGLETITIPSSVYKNTSLDDATGCYINYLEIEDLIFLPVFDREEDTLVISQFQNLFPARS